MIAATACHLVLGEDPSHRCVLLLQPDGGAWSCRCFYSPPWLRTTTSSQATEDFKDLYGHVQEEIRLLFELPII